MLKKQKHNKGNQIVIDRKVINSLLKKLVFSLDL